MKLLLKGLIAMCCGVTVITSAKHAEGLEFKPNSITESFYKLNFFYLIKIKIKHFISSQTDIWYITAQRTNRKGAVVLRSAFRPNTQRVSSWSLDSIKQNVSQNDVFTWLKIKSCILLLLNPKILYEITARGNNRKVLWC